MSTQFGEYHLIERVAAGGMAEIWRAEIRGIGGFKRDVAIKRILPEHTHDQKFVEMLLDEARIAARLSHPNIAQVIQCGLIDNTYYIVMELVDGVPLSRLLSMLSRAGERLPHDCAIHLGVGLLRALDCAHKAKSDSGRPLDVVHRDVSPHNLLVSAHGDAKLIDFGVAQAADKLHKTETGVLKGKITYMAPEQVQGGVVDARTDQYAAALVVAEMLTGKRVHSGQSEIDVLKAVIDADPAAIRAQLEAEKVPAGVVAAIVKSLARRADDRFVDCESLAAALLAALPVDVEAARSKLAAYVPRVRTEPRTPARDLDTEAPTKKLTPSGSTRDPGHPGAPPSSPGSLASSSSTTPLAHTALVDRPRSTSRDVDSPPTSSRLNASAARALGAAGALALGVAAFFVFRGADDEHLERYDTRVDAGAVDEVNEVNAVSAVNVVGAGDAGILVDAGNAAITPVRTAKKRATGTLDLACLPWCEITIDGKPGLRSPLRGHVLEVGAHTVDVVNPPTGKRATLKVRIDAGKATKESVRLE